MPTLDTTNMENIANVDFETYKALHLQGQDPAHDYYTAMKLAAEDAGLAFVEDYAEYAQNANDNSNINGVIANNYTAAIAENQGGDYSEGSENRLRMQYELMKEDLAARQDNIDNGGTGELSYQDTSNIYSVALQSVDLPPEASFFYIPLSTLAEHDPGKAQFLFQTVVNGEGFIDVIQDGLLLGFGANISGQKGLAAVLDDYAAQATWLAATFEAMQDIVATYPGDVSAINGPLEKYQLVAAFAGQAFDGLSGWAGWLAGWLASQFAGEF